MKNQMQSNGGKARAQALSPLRRREIAQEAAEARWSNAEPVDPEIKAIATIVKALKPLDTEARARVMGYCDDWHARQRQ